MTPAPDAEVLDILAKVLELRDQGLEYDLDELCGGREELVAAVQAALEETGAIPRGSLEDALQGRILAGRYQLQERLGTGAMGVVYQAQDLELQRLVAIKLLNTLLFSAAEAEARFLREAEAVAAIGHPSIVTIFDRGRAETGHPFLVMELLDGISLDAVLRQAKERQDRGVGQDLKWLREDLGLEIGSEASLLRLMVRWTAELAAGLDAAHSAGIIHRDIKPSNVFLRRDGRAVLIDFGIAAVDDHPTVGKGEGLLGTPAYMAPETLDRRRKPKPQIDVYGLAATLYHMVTLQAPYSGTPSQVLFSLARRDPAPALRLSPHLPRDLQAILDKGLARSPQARYGTVHDFESDLRAFLAHRPVSARPITWLERTTRVVFRSPAFRAATLVVALGLVALGLARWKDRQAETQRAQWQATWGQLPPGLTLWQFSNRRLEGERHARIRALLDDAVELEPRAFPTRLYRASFLLDHGDPSAAAKDLEVLAREIDTPYVWALSRSYSALPSSASDFRDLELDPGITAESPEDLFLQAYHVLRSSPGGSGLQHVQSLLAEDALANMTCAQEIRLLLAVGRVPSSIPRAERIAMYRLLHTDAVRLEALLGTRSAPTAHILGAALLGLERYEEAKGVIEEGVALAPFDHSLRSNLAVACRRLGSLEEAKIHVMKAIDLRFTLPTAHEALVRVLVDQKEFEAARQAVENAYFGGPEAGQKKRARLSAEVEYQHALYLWTEDKNEARESASRAVAQFEALEDTESTDHLIAKALAAGDTDLIVAPMLLKLSQDPSNWQGIRILLSVLPEALDSSQTLAIKTYLQSIVGHFALDNSVSSSEPHVEKSR